MILTAHCFARNAWFNKPLVFKSAGWNVEAANYYGEASPSLILKIERHFAPEEITIKLRETAQNQLHEVAIITEGLLAIHYGVAPPQFGTHEIITNIHTDIIRRTYRS